MTDTWCLFIRVTTIGALPGPMASLATGFLVRGTVPDVNHLPWLQSESSWLPSL